MTTPDGQLSIAETAETLWSLSLISATGEEGGWVPVSQGPMGGSRWSEESRAEHERKAPQVDRDTAIAVVRHMVLDGQPIDVVLANDRRLMVRLGLDTPDVPDDLPLGPYEPTPAERRRFVHQVVRGGRAALEGLPFDAWASSGWVPDSDISGVLGCVFGPFVVTKQRQAYALRTLVADGEIERGVKPFAWFANGLVPIADGNFTNRADVVFAVPDAAVRSRELVVEARLQAEADERRQQEELDAWWDDTEAPMPASVREWAIGSPSGSMGMSPAQGPTGRPLPPLHLRRQRPVDGSGGAGGAAR
ncbi:hypothetical protein DVS28_b0254 (plasmid) [Euzebya pacifica]|uniref:Uncharacterized protein n=1 Tax=Euzebya pacifica TaxID=1608957 RepID=A0A346Y6C7_9ACTN|nr:hypothetical protein [Euzebya pacifica]AXV10024.1 hypothetical protein DVS28_b0254 [Euzebya pacifica]